MKPEEKLKELEKKMDELEVKKDSLEQDIVLVEQAIDNLAEEIRDLEEEMAEADITTEIGDEVNTVDGRGVFLGMLDAPYGVCSPPTEYRRAIVRFGKKLVGYNPKEVWPIRGVAS